MESVSKDHALIQESTARNWGSNWNCHVNSES